MEQRNASSYGAPSRIEFWTNHFEPKKSSPTERFASPMAHPGKILEYYIRKSTGISGRFSAQPIAFFSYVLFFVNFLLRVRAGPNILS